MFWPFNILGSASPPPPNEGGGGDATYTDARVDELVARAGGTLGIDNLAVAQSCVNMWERCMSALMVDDGNEATMALTPDILALTARSLGVIGDAVFYIRAVGGGVALIPSSSFEVWGGPLPSSWIYRLDMVGSQKTETVRVPASEVLHFKLGLDRGQAWRGVAPLRRSSLTSLLARRLEVALADECTIPISRLLGVSGQRVGAEKIMNALDHRPGTSSLHIYQGPENGEPRRVGPQPLENEVSLREQIVEQVYGLFGISPLLFSTDADGQSLREAKRLFLSTTLRGLVSMMEHEVQRKLMAPAFRLSMSPMFITDEETAALSVSRRSSAFAKLTAGGVAMERALKLAGLEG